MGEQWTSNYQRLFEVKLLHHYWLDDGHTVFDLISDAGKQQRYLNAYDVRRFLQLTASQATLDQIRGLKAHIHYTAQGFSVSVPQGTTLSLNTQWLWWVRITDPDFFAYTALTLNQQRNVELLHPLSHVRYRYKQNVPVFSNLTGDRRDNQLFLSRIIPTLSDSDRIEALIRSGNALKQLVSDQPGAQSKLIHASWRKLPVYAHQGDIPALTPPPGLTGVPTAGIELTDDIPSSVYALIRLTAIRPDNSAFSWLNHNGQAKTPAPVFEIRFRNRATYWRYYDKSSGLLKNEESNPLPLTFFGNAGTGQKPVPYPPKISTDGQRIVRLNSDLYV